MNEDRLVLSSQKLRGEDGHRTLAVRLKQKIVARLDDLSGKTSTSRNKLIGILLEYALDHCVVEHENGETEPLP